MGRAQGVATEGSQGAQGVSEFGRDGESSESDGSDIEPAEVCTPAPPFPLALDTLLPRQAADVKADLAPCTSYGAYGCASLLECAEPQDFFASPASAAPPPTSALVPTVLALATGRSAPAASATQTGSAPRVNKMPSHKDTAPTG